MGRSRAAAKAAGSKTERSVADYLAATIDDRIDRRAKTGAKDKGDIGGLRVHGKRVVIEVKDTSKAAVKPYLDEAEVERINDGAFAAFVVQKRIGVGHTRPGDLLVQMTLRDLAAIITGERPVDADVTAKIAAMKATEGQDAVPTF